MKRKIFILGTVLLSLVMCTGTSALVVNDTQVWTSRFNIDGLSDGTLEIGPNGNLTINARVDQNHVSPTQPSYLIMNGGILVTTVDYKFPDNDGPVEMWINAGTFTANQLQSLAGRPDRGGGSMNIGGGVMIIQSNYLTGNEYDPARWLAEGTLLPQDGYELVLTDLGGGAVRIEGIPVNPCTNFAPKVDAGGPTQTTTVSTPTPMNASVVDDGKPWVHSCNPDDPCETPISVGLTYKWSVIDPCAAAGITFSPSNTDVNPTVTFTNRGVYRLRLTAWDDQFGVSPATGVGVGQSASDDVIIRVKDPAVDDVLVAHWKLNEGIGPTAADSALPNDVGTRGSTTGVPSDEPNWVDGWIPSETPNQALDFGGSSYVEVTNATSSDPNLESLEWEISMVAWFKVDQFDVNYQAILTKGDNSWRIERASGEPSVRLRCNGPSPNLDVRGTIDVTDGYWHHMVGTYDGQIARLYIDGVLDVEQASSGLINQNDQAVRIGGNTEQLDRGWKGNIDDVRVYSYAIPADGVSDSVAEIAKMGRNLVPRVNITDPCDVLLPVDNTLQMNATIIDLNNDTISKRWTADDPSVSFSDEAAEDPIAVFTQTGTFTLRLSVDDGTAGYLHGPEIFNEVTVEVTNPSCAEILADGLSLPTDLSGPSGVPDCYINIYDFAAVAVDFLRCYDVQTAGCENPYSW